MGSMAYPTGVRRRAAALFREGLGYRRAARRLCVPPSVTREWVRSYRAVGEEAFVSGTRKTYDYRHAAGCRQGARRRGRPAAGHDGQVRRGERAHDQGLVPPVPQGRRGGPEAAPRPEPTREELLETENERLRAKVAYLEKLGALRDRASRTATGAKR